MTTRTAFLAAYRAELERHEIPAAFLVLLTESAIRQDNGWQANSLLCQRAWHSIGGTGPVTLAKLRALP